MNELLTQGTYSDFFYVPPSIILLFFGNYTRKYHKVKWKKKLGVKDFNLINMYNNRLFKDKMLIIKKYCSFKNFPVHIFVDFFFWTRNNILRFIMYTLFKQIKQYSNNTRGPPSLHQETPTKVWFCTEEKNNWIWAEHWWNYSSFLFLIAKKKLA